MSFLGHPFQHDIFINYSHGAFDGKCDTDLKKWSLRFADSLRSELAGTGEFKNVSVFVDDSERADESVDRAEGLTSQLRHKAENSALLTVLMTPQYLDSSWCRDERGWWHANHHADTYRAGGRIFVCRVRPTDETLWPAELCDERRVPLVGYFCFDRNKHPDKARPFTWLETTDDLNEYKNLLSDVSGDMMCRLRAIKVALEERLRREQDAAHLAADSGQVIYLHGRRAHADVWKLANQTLDRSGFVVFSGRARPG